MFDAIMTIAHLSVGGTEQIQRVIDSGVSSNLSRRFQTMYLISLIADDPLVGIHSQPPSMYHAICGALRVGIYRRRHR